MNAGHFAQAMVEFALTLPILLMLLVGVFDAGRGSLAAASLNNAVREATRYGAVHYPTMGWESASSGRGAASAVGLTPTDLTITVSAVVDATDTYVISSGSYTFRPLAPGVTAIAGAIPLNATARMLAKP